jgi:hypothetical protein
MKTVATDSHPKEELRRAGHQGLSFREDRMAAPVSRLFSDNYAFALLLKARDLGYPMNDQDFLDTVTIQQLEDMIHNDKYDC